MKTCFKVLLPLLLLVTLPVVVQAQFTFTTNNGAITITGYTGPDGDMTIPSATNGYPVTTIAYGAFSYRSITSAIIPDSVTDLVGETFSYCGSLANVVIGNSVTNIGTKTFYRCPNLISIAIPGSVTSIGGQAFGICASLSAITVDATNSCYSSGDGLLFDKGQTTLIVCPLGKSGSCLLPNSVTKISDNAFAGCANLINVTIPNSVTSIGSSAFGGCSGLTNVAIGNNVTTIGHDAFVGCYGLVNVIIPNSVTNIGSWAFYNCLSLTNVAIGNSVSTIAGNTFAACHNLIKVIIPNSVTSIGDDAFAACACLSSVYFLGNTPSLGYGVFSGCGATVYYLPGATNWGATFGSRPSVLWNPQIPASGPQFGVLTNCFGFNVVGTTNIPLIVEACTGLAGASWTPLQTCSLTNGSIYFSDPQWTNYPTRLYRIRSP